MRVRRSSCLCGAEEASHDKAPTLSAPQPRVGAFSLALAKDRRADPHMGRAERDRGGEIGAHSHREQLQAVARPDLGSQSEMRCRRLLEWREAHQTGDLQSMSLAASLDE